MKKFIILIATVVFVVSCTDTAINEEAPEMSAFATGGGGGEEEPEDFQIFWAGQVDGSSRLRNIEYMLNKPDNLMASYRQNNYADLSDWGANDKTYHGYEAFASFLDVNVEAIQKADVVSFESNTRDLNKYESSTWMFSDGVHTYTVEYDYYGELPDEVVATGPLSPSTYSNYFEIGSTFGESIAYILFDLDDSGVDYEAPTFTVTVQSGSSYTDACPNPDAFGVLIQDQEIEVFIDIHPGSTINPINTKSGGNTPVAVLSTPDFDATQIDPLSVRFGVGEATEDHKKRHICDVNDDGLDDMVMHFRTKATGIKPGDTQACLVGTTVSGIEFYGCDHIRCRK